MTKKADILSRFSGEPGEGMLYLPDLTAWYDWRQERDTLPARWKNNSLPEIAQDLGAPVWLVACPWQIQTPGVEIQTTVQNGERVTRFETSAGTLSARWIQSGDGPWWQTEYPVKTEADLTAAMELIRARSYVLDTAEFARLTAMVGDEGVVAIEIPSRPYLELLYELMGLSEGPILLIENTSIIHELITLLETKLQHLIQEIAPLSGTVVFSHDNLDAQFISPRTFEEFLADSYRFTAEVLHQHDKYLLIHAGGPIRALLAPLAAAGVDGVEGIAAPPQSDVSLTDAREAVGPAFTLWGGIPQDFLMATHDQQVFENAVIQTVQAARGDRRVILGVADRVPADVELSKLTAIPSLVEQALSG